MGAPPNEDQLADMLSNPNMAQMMNEALNNPALVDVMINSNPMLRNNPNARQMLQSPLFRQMLSNPELLRQAARMQRAAGGLGGGAQAFPAPGATDTTPAGAPSAGAEGGNNAQNQQAANLFPFGMMGGAGGAGGAEAGAGAANPFAALFNPMGSPPATGAQPAAGDNATRDPSAPAGGNDAAANPFAGLFGAGAPPGGNQANPFNPFNLTPEQIQQFMGMMQNGGMGGMGGMGGLGGMGGFGEPAAPADTRPPEERYADQLAQLNEMGFHDFDQNVAALRRSGGNVQGAVNYLLGM